MSTTFGALKTLVSDSIRDSSNQTFSTATVGEMVQAALAEIGRITPEQFQENITLVADTTEYVLRNSVFGTSVPEIECQQVELWENVTLEPDRMLAIIPPTSGSYAHSTQSGWFVWNGTLYLPRKAWALFDGNEDVYYLRVWGYSPFKQPSTDADVVALSNEQQWALVDYARIEALERLNADRDLFTQWQTRSGNSDISPAGLMGMLSSARENWRRRKRELLRLRAGV